MCRKHAIHKVLANERKDVVLQYFQLNNTASELHQRLYPLSIYRKHSCISRTLLLIKFRAKNRGCGLYTRQLLSEGVKGLGRGHKLN